MTDHGACVRTCSGNTYEVDEGGIRKCAKCDGLCPKGRGLNCLCATCLTHKHNVVCAGGAKLSTFTSTIKFFRHNLKVLECFYFMLSILQPHNLFEDITLYYNVYFNI